VILLDTNVLIYAFEEDSEFYSWARELLINSICGEGAAANTVVLAELCVGDAEPATVTDRLQKWGIQLLDLPLSVSAICGRAYALYLENRRLAGQGPTAKTPLPDFFVGAHAEVLGAPLATADPDRYRTYFPDLLLLLPDSDSSD